MTNGNPTMHASDGVSIRDYIDLRFRDSQRAIDKAEEMMNRRLDGMNEFRDSLKDQQKAADVAATKYITRDELKLILEKLQDTVNSLKSLADIATGKASMKSVIGAYAIAVVGLLIAIIKAFAK